MKLSKVQENAVSKMRQGYELGCWRGVARGAHFSLQKGGCGMGGDAFSITLTTFHSLLDKGIIQPYGEFSFRLVRYELTELGKTIKLTIADE